MSNLTKKFEKWLSLAGCTFLMKDICIWICRSYAKKFEIWKVFLWRDPYLYCIYEKSLSKMTAVSYPAKKIERSIFLVRSLSLKQDAHSHLKNSMQKMTTVLNFLFMYSVQNIYVFSNKKILKYLSIYVDTYDIHIHFTCINEWMTLSAIIVGVKEVLNKHSAHLHLHNLCGILHGHRMKQDQYLAFHNRKIVLIFLNTP